MPVPPRADLQTHRVTNQPPLYGDLNLYDTDIALQSAVRRLAGDWLDRPLKSLGADVGSPQVLHWGAEANRHTPELVQFDAYGHRLDEVRYHDSYHQLMTLAMRHRIHDLTWTDPGPAPHLAHAAMLALLTQAEAGVMCPMNMTYASVAALRGQGDVAETWVRQTIGGSYDAPLAPFADKAGLTIGMAMTEKQGGSDVRANTTQAEAVDGGYLLRGHKWFCSAPMCDGFLTLAYLDGGLSCFLVPRVRPDCTRNAIHVMRLKDKLGNRSNASSEIEYHDAFAYLIGEPGRGVKAIIEMVHHTRLGTISATLGIMRGALSRALHHVTHRSAFQRRLIDQPLMRAVLADLQLEYEAAVALVTHIAALFDARDARTQAYVRLAVALAKYLLTKRCPTFVVECLECFGGAGYVEDSQMPRLYKEAPLNGIWEGSGNVIALDIQRTLAKLPEAGEVLVERIGALGADAAQEAQALLHSHGQDAAAARHLAERLARLLQRSLLTECAPDAVSDGFARWCASGAASFGAGVPGIETDAILERAAGSG